jgi:tetratricopeptide (TPR) repeat protein
MSSLTAKENRRRSPVTQRSAAKKARKARPAKNKVGGSPKSKKLTVSRAAKISRAPKKARRSTKSAQPKKSVVKKAGPPKRKRTMTRPVAQSKRAATKRGRATRVEARGANAAQRAMPEPKPLPSPKAIAAIRAFEHALKLFNRHDFSAARASFEQIIDSHADQTDIAAPVRTYLAICEQKMARASTKTRSPDALYNQGVFEFNRGNVEDAIDIFERALKSEPRADHLLYSLAAAYAREGEDVKAVEALRKAIAANPVHRSHARHDPDFTPLRSNREFLRVSGLDLEYNE